MWVIGGYDGSVYYNSVWYSNDGINWYLATNNAAFSPRQGHVTIDSNGVILVIGGFTVLGNEFRDVWASSDGINWYCLNSNAPFGTRALSAVIEYANRNWLIAGSYKRDVWYTQSMPTPTPTLTLSSTFTNTEIYTPTFTETFTATSTESIFPTYTYSRTETQTYTYSDTYLFCNDYNN